MDQMYFRDAFPDSSEFWDSRNREQAPVIAHSVEAGMGWRGDHALNLGRRGIPGALPCCISDLDTPPVVSALYRYWWLPTGRLLGHSLNTQLWGAHLKVRYSIAAPLKNLSVVLLLPPKLSISAHLGMGDPPRMLLKPFPASVSSPRSSHRASPLAVSPAHSAFPPLVLPSSDGPFQAEVVPFQARNMILQFLHLRTNYPVATCRKFGRYVLQTRKATSNLFLQVYSHQFYF